MIKLCSYFQQYGEYFPGTGDLRDVGAGKGKYYSGKLIKWLQCADITSGLWAKMPTERF